MGQLIGWLIELINLSFNSPGPHPAALRGYSFSVLRGDPCWCLVEPHVVLGIELGSVAAGEGRALTWYFLSEPPFTGLCHPASTPLWEYRLLALPCPGATAPFLRGGPRRELYGGFSWRPLNPAWVLEALLVREPPGKGGQSLSEGSGGRRGRPVQSAEPGSQGRPDTGPVCVCGVEGVT